MGHAVSGQLTGHNSVGQRIGHTQAGHSMKRSSSFLIALVFFLTANSLSFPQRITIPDNEVDQLALGLPVDVKDQVTFLGLGKTTWWMVTLILPEEYYSKGNLERIFHYYSEKYPNKKDILRVNVFGDEGTFKQYLKSESFGTGVTTDRAKEEQVKLPAKETWVIPHATYERLCYNEFYYYSLDLQNPDKREKVVLKGQSQTLTVIPSDCK